MSTDGAQIGVGAEAALSAVMGGEQPTEFESAGAMGARIMALTEDPNTYGGTAEWMANRIITWLMACPGRAQEAPEVEYDWDADPDRGSDGLKPEFLVHPGWSRLMEEDGYWPDGIDLTGFMWGWAVNAARRVLELPEVPNPAIVEI